MKALTCSCGRVVTGQTSEELLAAVEQHIQAEHGQREHSHVASATIAIQYPQNTNAVDIEEDEDK
jgi:hypothetical protein